MKFVLVYARIYAECLRKAFKAIRKNVWTVLLPAILVVALDALGHVLPRDRVGGIFNRLALDAVGSCYLYFLGEVVANSRVGLSEFRKSIGAYFWAIMNVLFVEWIAEIALGMVLRQNPRADVAWGMYKIALFVLLNAVPEVLYEKGTRGGLATMQRSLQFIQEHWIEWFIPNLLLGWAAWEVWNRIPPSGVGYVAALAAFGALLHGVMVFRGFLFEALDGTTHRQRMYRYRAPS
jgi:hypothetical protein